MRQTRHFFPWLISLTLLIAIWGCTPELTREAPPRISKGAEAMVATPEDHATQIGLEVLKNGGNAADAAIAVHFALAVTYPQAGNLGGAGFMLYRTAEGEILALDFRETAPLSIDRNDFLDEEGRPKPNIAWRGGLAVGTPGMVRGMAAAHEAWGTQPWSSLVRPSIRLAEQGWVLNTRDANLFLDTGKHLKENPASRVIFAPEGEFLQPGERLVQSDLAKTLETIANQGATAFYKGPIAEAIAQTVQAHGGQITTKDLESYDTVFRDPLRFEYGPYEIISFPPPSSGGVALAQLMGMLERSNSKNIQTIHRMAEAERRVYADRSRWLGDPSFGSLPIRALLHPEYLEGRAASIRPDAATPSTSLDPGNPLPFHESEETLHFSIVAPDGSAASITTTLNGAFGTGIVVPGTGILLNNGMDDFALAPGIPNEYGLLGGEANAVKPAKRPLSSMTPTMVLDPSGELKLVLGSPGGSKIITSVYQVLIAHLDWGLSIDQAVDQPRFHHQWFPDEIQFEEGAFDTQTQAALRALGHTLTTPASRLGNVVAIGREDGKWIGVADARRGGTSRGF